MTDDTLTTNLSSDRRKSTSDSSDELTQYELERRSIEVPCSHHKPNSDGMDEDSSDPDPFVAICPLCEGSGDDCGNASSEDVGLTAKARKVLAPSRDIGE
jgi:hypothetical protein